MLLCYLDEAGRMKTGDFSLSLALELEMAEKTA